jgi:LuxR family transcriptional regulator, maltose regulon positive regulatory protein
VAARATGTRRPPFDFLPSKLEVPRPRPGLVPRGGLVERLHGIEATVVLVEAPAGYGKTTLLAQWAKRARPRAAWLALDADDDDPAVLLRYLAAAVGRVESIDTDFDGAAGAAGGGLVGVRRLTTAISAMTEPITLLLDHVESLTSVESRDVLTELVLRLPQSSRIALASRHPVGLPTARLRASGSLVEVGAADLAMSNVEATDLLRSAGVEVTDAEIAGLVERTEGWPAGLYLAALALRTVPAKRDVGFTFSGNDRFMTDYLRSELLDHVSPSEVEFLIRTSVLDAMSGPLCDATLGATGSERLLEQLESKNLLIVPLDHRREWYRYHHLFGELLATELRRREPDAVAGLHRNAAAWCEANGLPETALAHAQAVGDTDGVARLILELAQPVWASGRVDTVTHWMEWIEDHRVVAQYPALAVHGALIFALLGRAGDADRWAAAAEAAPRTGTLADGSTMEALYAYLTALLARDGAEQMRVDARTAWRGLAPSSPYRATMLFTEGVSYLLEDEPDRADPILADAVDAADAAGAAPLTAVLLAERGMVAAARDDWDAVESFDDRAMTIMAEGRYDEYWTSALVYAWAARVALRRGDIAAGRQCLGRSARLRPLLTYALPVVSLQSLLELARAYISLADTGGARAVLRQAADITQRRPRLGVLPADVERLRRQLDTMTGEAIGASSLTTAELRLLPLLPTHLSFREIGERLYLSRHTVKAQAISIYRKLGVSSRTEAIERMELLGLHGAR